MNPLRVFLVVLLLTQPINMSKSLGFLVLAGLLIND
jgi:hypothetical protein